MIKTKKIMICDICRKRTKKNVLIERLKLLYLLFFLSCSFWKWVLDYKEEFNLTVVCPECFKSFNRWKETRKN